MAKTGYIYKIAIKDGSLDECYIGSTSRIRERRRTHKSACNNPNNKDYNYYVYQFIRENGGFDNFDLYELEEVKYDDKRELHKIERRYIETLKPKLNKIIPTRTFQEYYQDNKDDIREKHKTYRENNKEAIRDYYRDNKDMILAKQKEKYVCACGSTFRHADKARHERSKKHQEYLKQNESIDLGN